MGKRVAMGVLYKVHFKKILFDNYLYQTIFIQIFTFMVELFINK